mgnify:CR=1 FL=1
MRINNNNFQKNSNISRIIEEIWKKSQISRIDIARELKLYRSTVSNIINSLLDNKIILENLQWLVDQKKEVIVRIPIIPDFNFDEKTINEMAGILSSMGITNVDLLPFHQFGERKYDLLNYEYSYKGVAGLNNEDLVHLKNIMESYDIKTQIGG